MARSRSFPPLILSILLFHLLCSKIPPGVYAGNAEFGLGFSQMECDLKVPKAEFVGSMETAMGAMKKATSILSKFENFLGDFRQENAVLDCRDLLDSSSDILSWSVSASKSRNRGKDNGTGNIESDLRTWLSAALSNQDTCLEGFNGTKGVIRNAVSGNLNHVTSMIKNLLNMINTPAQSRPNKPTKARHVRSSAVSHGGFSKLPSWVNPRDRKLLLLEAGSGPTADVVVTLDGTGNFTRITEAVLAAPDYSTRRFVIYVKKGVYEENVEIKRKKWNIMIMGDGKDSTVVSGNRSFVDGWTTFRSATFAVSGRGFIARDITFRNTAGPAKHQAVALRSDSDLSVFYRCAMRGYQDTLYVHTMRQFFRECLITGTVDFIFGDATAVFQNCEILATKGLPNQKNTITAQGRKDINEPTGFSIQFSNISTDYSDPLTSTYLGRPWKPYSRTVIMESYIGGGIRPEGWLEWNGEVGLATLYYGEFMNNGPGAGVGGRVKWPGFHVMNRTAEADAFTVARFIDGNVWLPPTGVKFTAGLGS